MHKKQPSDVIVFVRYWLSANLPVWGDRLDTARLSSYVVTGYGRAADELSRAQY